MFRAMRRFKQQVPQEECIAILKSEKRGVLAVLGDDGYPYAVPLNFLYEENDGKIYFHCAKEGHKIDAIAKCAKASFCVLGKDNFKEGDWAAYVTSVVAFGKIVPVADKEKTLEKVLKIGLKYHPTPEDAKKELEMAKDRVLCLEMAIEHMTGKFIHEK